MVAYLRLFLYICYLNKTFFRLRLFFDCLSNEMYLWCT